MARRHDHLVSLRPRPDLLHIGQGRTVLTMGVDGWIGPETPESGLFVHETRLLSAYRWHVAGQPPRPVALSSVAEHSWLGYYVTLPPDVPRGALWGGVDEGSGQMLEDSERSVELRLSRFVGGGLHEDVDLVNYTLSTVRFALEVEVDADFADQAETRGERLQRGRLTRTWSAADAELCFAYEAEQRRAPGEPAASLSRGVVLRVRRATSAPRFADGVLSFAVELAPQAQWHACVDLAPRIDGRELTPRYGCGEFQPTANALDQKRETFLARSTGLSPPGAGLAPTVRAALGQAKRDLASLRLFDLDQADGGWTVAAGLPLYVALYGRDVLTVAWQAALLGPELMQGSLAALAASQGTRRDDWRDEAPGRMLHEAHTGPLAVLGYNPRRRYYGSVTTSGFYPVVVAELWHWTGDRERVRPFLEPALQALAFLDRECRDARHGFYAYRSRSPQGVRHQAWKDSPDAIVYEDGAPVAPPVATCEEQAFVYLAKLEMAEVLEWFGEPGAARRLWREARALRQRFNDAFWMDEPGFFAMGLDADGRRITSISSNPGHCLAAGIVDRALVPRTAARLLADDLFSGWGIRTLSAQHPGYNPFSYHRGSVWPVEQASFVFGFARHGLHRHVETLAGALVEAARLFAHHRLPEVFSGHPRDAAHPFPALYPQANSPQAWSASALFCILQALLGLYPYAPLGLLFVDPHLPPWLPELRLRGLRVGGAVISLRFWRDGGRSEYEVLDVRGRLRVVRQPSPWSLTAGWGERARDVAQSLARW